MSKTAVFLLCVWNASVFALYGLDKLYARRRQYRIPERALIGCAFLLGSAGAALGMLVFRHKTRHVRFRLLVMLALVLHLLLALIAHRWGIV